MPILRSYIHTSMNVQLNKAILDPNYSSDVKYTVASYEDFLSRHRNTETQCWKHQPWTYAIKSMHGEATHGPVRGWGIAAVLHARDIAAD